MTFVEQIARAFYDGGDDEGDWRLGDLDETGRLEVMEMAEDALEAMRHPTQAMLDAGGPDGLRVWQAMIDAALAEVKP
jgi:hypothetical protein